MKVEHLEILVEEPSMEVVLRAIVPKIAGDLSFEIYPHQGKQDLLTQLPHKLRGYSAWLPETFRIMVVVDRDDDNCATLKRSLEKTAQKAGLRTRSMAKGRSYQIVNRLAIEELEAWFFGDWGAVCSAYPRTPATTSAKAQFRRPDAIKGGTWEALERILQQAGYFRGGLGKIEAARAISHHMVPSRNTSASFRAIHGVLAEIAADSDTRAAATPKPRSS